MRCSGRRRVPGRRAEPLWKLGDQLLKFGLRRGAGGAGTHVSLRAEREGELGDIVPDRGVDNDEEIIVAGRQIDFLDFNTQFLRELSRGLSALGSVLDRP